MLRSATSRAIAALSITQIIGWGATFNLPAVTGTAMAADLGMPLAFIMAGPTLMLVTMAAASWSVGRIFEERGARIVMVAGSVIAAAGLAMLSLTSNPVPYVLSWLLLGLAGSAALTTAAQIAVTEIAGEKSRQALSVLMLATGLTSTLSWPLTGLLQAQWGWRTTTLSYAVLMLAVCLPLHWLFLSRQPRRLQRQVDDSPVPPIDPLSFALTAASLAANGFVTWGFSLTIILLFEARGLSHVDALFAASSIGLAQLAARLIDLAGSRRWSGMTTGLVATALFPIAFGLLLTTAGFGAALTFALVYGLASGTAAVTRATLPLQIFPPRAYARASARLAVPLNLSFAAAPPIFAAIINQSGAETALWVSTTMSLFALLALWALVLRHRRTSRLVEG